MTMPKPTRFSERKGFPAQRGCEGPMSMKPEYIQTMRIKALRCRELAETASDAEVAEELLRIAAELETAVHVFEDERSKEAPEAGPEGRLGSEAPLQAS
jgi:hypothetical protein